MKIAGLQKMTLLDYPGKVACTVFLPGCNFRCPFCHNSGILSAEAPEGLSADALLAFLQKRRGLLDGVCVTGGEPTLQPDLAALLGKIKALGYLVKLDTNGSRPEVLKALVEAGLVDYVAMDIKNAPERYPLTVGCSPSLSQIKESIAFLLRGNVDYELRTTVVEEFHDEQSVLSMGQWLGSLVPGILPDKLFLQPYRDSEQVLSPGLHTPSADTLQQFVRLLEPFVHAVMIRGAD